MRIPAFASRRKPGLARCPGFGLSIRVFLTALLLPLLALSTGAAFAQSDAEPPPQEKPLVDPAVVIETSKLFAICDDIDKLAIINPLRLTTTQLDQLIAMLVAHQEQYTRRYIALNATVLQYAEEAHQLKRGMLTGKPLPPEFGNKMTQLLRRRDEFNRQELINITQKFRAILTPRQRDIIISMVRDSEQKSGKPSAGDDNLKISEYAYNLLQYTRLVPLLKEIRAARTASQQEAKTPPAKASKPKAITRR